MNWDQRCIRLCAGMLLTAVMLRLWAGGALAAAGQAVDRTEAASFFLYLNTGRVVRAVTDLPPATIPTEPAPTKVLTFDAADTKLIGLDDNCKKRPDLADLLTRELGWDMAGEGPKVLILHSHTTESYTQSGDRYEESSPYRTLDPGHNMIALGQLVADALEDAGIGVIHDTALHDYPSYNGSYTHAASSTKAYLAQYPTIELVLDLHRDAADTPSGQMATRCSLDGQSAAQLMFVVGTDTRLDHPDWERNLSAALKLQVLLEKENPGICRDLNLTKNRYNQHLGTVALLVEIGAAGNTLDQARLAARELAEAVRQLIQNYP